MFMNIAEVKSLPLREKFQLLEMIWEDLRSRVETMPVSRSDRDLLDARIERVESGKVAVHHWDDVKHSIGGR